MAEVENDCFPSKRMRLSPEREDNIVNTETEQHNTNQESDVDRETFSTNYGGFQTSNIDLSEQDGVSDAIENHEQFAEDNFPSCYSVEDDIDNGEEHHYQPIAGPMGWVQRQMNLGINPKEILSYMVPHAKVPSDLQDDHVTLWKIVIDLLTSPSPRQKLDHVNSLDDVVNLMSGCKNIIVLTGAGVSVSCGIPDFRSRDGIYARLSEEYPDLPDPQAMFDITYFNQNPYPFFKFAKEIYPGQFQPSLCHKFIRQIEKHGSLLRNYSQNIDTLEQVAGINNVIQCHGSFSTASCTNCKYKVSASDIKGDIFNQKIPLCTKCKGDDGKLSIMKPDIVFFGENLPANFYHHLENDSEKADLLIVIGSSLKVRPVALIPSRIDADVPQILINREPLRHMTFDVELLGDCDVIVAELCKRLGGDWTEIIDGVEPRPVDRSQYLQLNSSDLVPPSTSDGLIDIGAAEINGKTLEQAPNRPPKVAFESYSDLDQSQPFQELPSTQLPFGDSQTNIHPLKDNQEDLQANARQPDVGQTDKETTCTEQGLDGSSSSKEPLSSVSMPTNSQGDGGVGVQSVGQDTCSISTDEQRQGRMAPGDIPAGDVHNNQDTAPDDTDLPPFIFNPPSRYIFYGAEITGSPVHSPFCSPVRSDDDNSDCSDNASLSRDDLECSNLEGNGYSSSGDGSEGYGSGVMSNTDLTNYDLKLITGALGNYHCVSEENSVMSGLDLIANNTPSIKGTSDDLLHVSDVLVQNYMSPSSSNFVTPRNTDTDDIGISMKNTDCSDDTADFFPCDSSIGNVKPAWT